MVNRGAAADLAAARRESWRLALPLILSNLSVPLLGLVDSAVVGHLEDPRHLAAVALGATLISTLYFLFGFLRMGTTALTAQAQGAADRVEQRAGLARGLLVAGCLGLGLCLAGPLIAGLAAWALQPPPEAAPGFRTYVTIRLLGAPAALGSFVLLGWFLGMQDARRPLVLMIATNAVNAMLAVILVVGLGMTSDGVALATAVAEWLGLGLGMALAVPRLRRLGGRAPTAAVLEAGRLRRLLAVNRDLFLRSALLQVAFLVMAGLGARQGAVVLAANALLGHLFTIAAYGLDGFAHATEAVVGKAVGARDGGAYRAAVRVGHGNGLKAAVTMTLVFWLGGGTLIGLLTDQAAVLETAATYLPYAVTLPVVAVWAFVWDGVFFGATRTAELRDGMVVSLAVFALCLVASAAWGNHGLWLSFLAFLAARGGLLWALHRRRPLDFPPLERPSPVPK